MAIDYFNEKITGKFQPFMENPVRIKDLQPVSEAYVAKFAQWFDERLLPSVDISEFCYGEEQISQQAFPEKWLRVIRIPKGLIVDASHRVDIYDPRGRLLKPVERELPFVNAESVVARGYIKTPMQLEAVAKILKQEYGYTIGESLLHKLVDFHEDQPMTGND